MDPQAVTGLAARLVHLNKLIDADRPGCLPTARAELLDLVLDLVPGTRWAALSHGPDPAEAHAPAGHAPACHAPAGHAPVWAVTAGGPIGDRLDELQSEAGEGPALLALSTGEVVTSNDLETETRWPEFRARAVAGTPARSLCSHPLGRTGLLRSTALTLYSDLPANFSGERAALVRLVAASTGLLVRAMLCREPQARG